MPTTSVNIGFRPPRIATLVRRDSLSDIAEAAAANTHLWGGRFNPIVAVGDDVDAATGEVRLFRPDLVTVIGEPTPEQSAVLSSMKHIGAPALAGEPFDQLEGRSMPYDNVPEPAELLRSLIARGALQAVFSLECPSCAVRSDHRLDDLGNHMTCPRCSQPFDPAPLLERGTWKYRPSGFFATLSSHGSVPVVLAMIRMLETLHMHNVIIEASHDVAGNGWREECDFVVLWRDRDGGPVMAVGESKGGEQPIEQSDVTSLERVANAIRALGVECYLVFATTRREFTEAETALFPRLRDDFADQSSLDGDSWRSSPHGMFSGWQISHATRWRFTSTPRR